MYYACRKYPGYVSVFGWEGDKDAPIAFIDGSYLLRDRKNTLITFGLSDVEGKIEWFNKEGWLPCLVSKYRAGGFDCTVESFADIFEKGENKFEIAYSRMTLKNIGGKTLNIPRVSKLLIPLGEQPDCLKPGEIAVLDYAVGIDISRPVSVCELAVRQLVYLCKRFHALCPIGLHTLIVLIETARGYYFTVLGI